MRIIAIIGIIFLKTTFCIAQEGYIEMGKVVSDFKYVNSLGERLDLLKGTNNSIGLGFRGPFNWSKNKVFLTGGISIQKYSASGFNNSLASSYSWDVNYLGINVGVDYNVAKVKGFQIYLKGLVSIEFLLQGTQIINNQNFNLRGVEEFDGLKPFIKGGAGVNYFTKNDVAIFSYYLIGSNFFTIGGDKSDGEKLTIITHNINIGVSLPLNDFRGFK